MNIYQHYNLFGHQAKCIMQIFQQLLIGLWTGLFRTTASPHHCVTESKQQWQSCVYDAK